jgi:hypothetical protein
MIGMPGGKEESRDQASAPRIRFTFERGGRGGTGPLAIDGPTLHAENEFSVLRRELFYRRRSKMGDVDLSGWTVNPLPSPSLGWKGVRVCTSCCVIAFFWVGLIGFVSSVVFYTSPHTSHAKRVYHAPCSSVDGITTFNTVPIPSATLDYIACEHLSDKLTPRSTSIWNVDGILTTDSVESDCDGTKQCVILLSN